MRPNPHQVVQNSRNLVKHDADITCAFRDIDAEQLFDGEHVAMFVTHHRNIIEPIHVTNGLVIGLGFGQFLGAAMQQADMGVGALDDFAIHLQYQAQYAVGSRMLGAEIERKILDFRHQSFASPAPSTTLSSTGASSTR